MPRSMVLRSEVNGTTWSTTSLKLYNDNPSTGRRIAWAKRRAELSSSGSSRRVLKLVSISRTMESGSSDSLSNTDTFCNPSSSSTWKFSLVNPATGAPCWSVTVTNTLTSFTSTLKVVSSLVSAGLTVEDLGLATQGGFGTSLEVWAWHTATASSSMADRIFIGWLVTWMRGSAQLGVRPDLVNRRLPLETALRPPIPRHLQNALSSR